MSTGIEGALVETGIEVAARLAVATLSELLSRANEQERATIERHLASIKGRPARDLGPAIDASAKAAMDRVTGASAPTTPAQRLDPTK